MQNYTKYVKMENGNVKKLRLSGRPEEKIEEIS